MDQFLGEGVNHDSAEFYIHKNTFDFQIKDVATKDIPGEGVPHGKKLNEGRDTASKSASQPTKYELHLKASREAEKEERRRRRGFYFDSD